MKVDTDDIGGDEDIEDFRRALVLREMTLSSIDFSSASLKQAVYAYLKRRCWFVPKTKAPVIKIRRFAVTNY